MHCTEILLEPMSHFEVTSVSKQSSFTIVRIRALKSTLLLDEEIPPGCIQHIVSGLMKQDKMPRKLCDKLCFVLLKTPLYDSGSRIL